MVGPRCRNLGCSARSALRLAHRGASCPQSASMSSVKTLPSTWRRSGRPSDSSKNPRLRYGQSCRGGAPRRGVLSMAAGANPHRVAVWQLQLKWKAAEDPAAAVGVQRRRQPWALSGKIQKRRRRRKSRPGGLQRRRHPAAFLGASLAEAAAWGGPLRRLSGPTLHIRRSQGHCNWQHRPPPTSPPSSSAREHSDPVPQGCPHSSTHSA
mmetsp:Transcript_29419/g.64332  ORF Transcript_29419/g.64332 Transcript_29419/m.64332 type:complete len:209 (-) Transcript_29419:939-1565(-)